MPVRSSGSIRSSPFPSIRGWETSACFWSRPPSLPRPASHSLHFLQRTGVPAKTALITGAGPIGLLAALAACQYGLETYVVDIVDSGPKPDLVRELGAHYHAGSAGRPGHFAGSSHRVHRHWLRLTRRRHESRPGRSDRPHGHFRRAAGEEIDLNVFNKNMVLSNKVLFGSVNAGAFPLRGGCEGSGKSGPRLARTLDQPPGSRRAVAGSARTAAQ